jgi:catechol 2,3-dioxygenase-like lactoylglutathione lyase family enzyme
MILRVRSQTESVRFYQQVLAFRHEGRAGPFDILRVHEGFTLDLMEQVPHDPVHLAFCLQRAAFETIHGRLVQLNIPLGNGPFDRSGGPAAKSLGARGMADSLYFYDPDEHNIEIRTYESR